MLRKQIAKIFLYLYTLTATDEQYWGQERAKYLSKKTLRKFRRLDYKLKTECPDEYVINLIEELINNGMSLKDIKRIERHLKTP